MRLTPCAVEGCTGLTSDASEICPACRTKIERGEIRVLPAVDERERLDAIMSGTTLLLAGIAGILLASWFDATGGSL